MDILYVLTTMAGYPSLYRAELAGVPREMLHWKPSEREWSLAEVIAHLADSDEIYYNDRCLPVARLENPSFPGFDQEQYAAARRYNEQDAMANLERFAKWNARLVALGWETDWDRTGIHAEAGRMTFGQLLLACFGHYASHLSQMRRIKKQYMERE